MKGGGKCGPRTIDKERVMGVGGREEVRAKMSVKRLEELYARGELMPCKSSVEKVEAYASRLEIQMIRPFLFVIPPLLDRRFSNSGARYETSM